VSALGGLEAIVGGLEDKTKKTMVELLRALVPFLRFGPLDSAKAENFNGFNVTSTTATSTSEFSIEHGMGRAPYRAMPVIDLSVVGSRLVPLTVTRAADARRVYVKTESGFTNAEFSLYVE